MASLEATFTSLQHVSLVSFKKCTLSLETYGLDVSGGGFSHLKRRDWKSSTVRMEAKPLPQHGNLTG